MKCKALCCGTSLLVIALGSGCQMIDLIKENNERLDTTNETITENTTAVTTTTQTMQDLKSSLQQVSSLKEPMKDLAALGPTFNKVADLDGPMKELAGLRDPMVQLSYPVSVLTRLTPVQLAASVILAIVAFFALLFLTIWAAVRLALRHRPA